MGPQAAWSYARNSHRTVVVRAGWVNVLWLFAVIGGVLGYNTAAALDLSNHWGWLTAAVPILIVLWHYSTIVNRVMVDDNAFEFETPLTSARINLADITAIRITVHAHLNMATLVIRDSHGARRFASAALYWSDYGDIEQWATSLVAHLRARDVRIELRGAKSQ